MAVVSVQGTHPLTYTEVDAWARRAGRSLQAFEVEWLMALDDAWLYPQLGAESQEAA